MFALTLDKLKIAVIGLGYVGLPLAVAFGRKYQVLGYDLNKKRISELRKGLDKTNEVDDFSKSKYLEFSYDENELSSCNCYIITVPTPVNNDNEPDISMLLSATSQVAKYLTEGNIVIYESTVYPGCTEDDCVPLLERISNLKFNEAFWCGYSPERINPGDKNNRLENIIKVTSGSDLSSARFINELYSSIIPAGTFQAESIKVAEAAKVIENTQRDINIALMNELSIIFDKLEIDTESVLKAAETKWNFMKFRPGLVGGHCIGVDPYYLASKAQKVGYKPELILAGRNLNEKMSEHIINKLTTTLNEKMMEIKDAKILILGFSFKENCPDFRNTKVLDIYNGLTACGGNVVVYDPVVDNVKLENDLHIKMIGYFDINDYDVIIIAVAHDIFKNDTKLLSQLVEENEKVIFDLKHILPLGQSSFRL